MGLESQRFENYDYLEPIPHKYAFVIISFSLCFFLFVSWLVNRFGYPKSVAPSDHWKWKNLFVSWVHASIVGTWDILCFILYPEMTTDLIGFHNMFIYSMVAFSTGYFFYDFLDIVVNKRSKSCWEVLVHHVAVSSTFFHNLVTSRCLAYTVVALMAEINSISLHLRKLMQMLKFKFDAPLYRANVYLNLFTFVIGRFFALVWIVVGMTLWYERVGIKYMYWLSTSIFIMWVINIVLFQRLYNSDIKRYKKGSSKSQKHMSNGNGYDHVLANNNTPLLAGKLRSSLKHVNNHVDSCTQKCNQGNDDFDEAVNHKMHNGLKTS